MQHITDDKLVEVGTGSVQLEGNLTIPADAKGIVLFAHGSGSSRHSTRNRFVADLLQEHCLATLLMDLLTGEEEEIDRLNGHLRFDIPMLAARLEAAVDWLGEQDQTKDLPVGLFGASTGAAAALITAASRSEVVRAVVSRGGRPDLAEDKLSDVQAPTLLIVGGRDHPVIEMNEEARTQLTCDTEMEVVQDATHLFEEEGALEKVAGLAADWFSKHLSTKNLTDIEGGVRSGLEASTPKSKGENGHVSRRVTSAGPRNKGNASPMRTTEPGVDHISKQAEAFDDIETASLDGLLRRIGDARIVLIGKASHGTSEFYRMRQRITRELITRRGFNVIAAEADWPDAQHLDAYARRRDPKPDRPTPAFARFPSWMWRNHEVYEFVEWLRDYNDEVVNPQQKAGFYGLDLYSLFSSIDEVLKYLNDVDPDLAEVARKRYECLDPFRSDPGRYGSAVISNPYHECQDEVAAMLSDLLKKSLEFARMNGESFLHASQNARVVASAERFYKLMYLGAPDSWNLRDSHMFETLNQLLEYRGPDSKAVVWAHNSHVGDASATEMSARGETNIGQLVRESFHDGTYTIGFGTHTGVVAAAKSWGGDVEFQKVRPSRPDSYEYLCHLAEMPAFCLPLHEKGLRDALQGPLLERAIGVIYRPETERESHYFRARLPEQFDEYIWFDESEAVKPFERATAPSIAERHPFLLVD